ncbi:hypothetical protein CF327_g409 [Tilletia walkeri]|uniref:Peregrin n=1 Tax=Tilletia walkeri TaxID=117179 RepID=A0A8X7NHS4_9BASI|nr:hypothetical protein CF327_g409 [Tilletia walkeri]KAE8272121.1 hypothetical protein A4X09_0g183 [Tilletia walkeri]
MPIPTTPPYPPLSFSLPKVSFRKIPAAEALELSVPAGVHERQFIEFGFNNGSEFVRPEHYLRYVEPVEAELKNRVEYDMDEQDQQWLDFINAERKRSQMDVVSYEIFEILMDRIEKEWFDLMKRVPKKTAAAAGDANGSDSVEDTRCAICDDGECENSNAIVFCDGCNLAAHQDCYGIPYIPEGQWLCRKCTVSPDRAVSCIFCPHEGGAFKQTSNGKWAHLLCAIWIPETGVSNPVYMEPIDSVETIPKARWKLNCYLCRQKVGACIQCDNRNCCVAFHVTCARDAGLLLRFTRARADSHKNNTGSGLGMDIAEAANIDTTEEGEKPAEIIRACCHKHLPKEVRAERERLGITFPTSLNPRGDDDDTPTGSRANTPMGGQSDHGGEYFSKKKKGKSASGPAALNGSAQLANGVVTPLGRTSKAARAYKKSYRAGPPLVPKYILDRVMEYTHKVRIRAKPLFVAQLARYWSLKREARRGASLLKRLHLEPWTAAPVPKEQAESEKAKKLQFLKLLREDLERVRMLAELSRKREREKHKQIEVLRSTLMGGLMFPYSTMLRKAFTEITSLDRQSLFTYPVSSVEVPDYYEIIKTPMDWNQISARLDQNAYTSVEAFRKDIQQVFTNARIYNKPDTAYHKLALKLDKAAEPVLAALEKTFATIHAEENTKMRLAVQAWKQEQETMRQQDGPTMSEDDLEHIVERLEGDLTFQFEPEALLLDLIEDPELCGLTEIKPDNAAVPNGDSHPVAVKVEGEASNSGKLNFVENLIRQDTTIPEDFLSDGTRATISPEMANSATMQSTRNRKKKGTKRSRTRTTSEGRPSKRTRTVTVGSVYGTPLAIESQPDLQPVEDKAIAEEPPAEPVESAEDVADETITAQIAPLESNSVSVSTSIQPEPEQKETETTILPDTIFSSSSQGEASPSAQAEPPSSSISALSTPSLSSPEIVQAAGPAAAGTAVTAGPVPGGSQPVDNLLAERRSLASMEPTTLEVKDVSSWDTFKRFNSGWVLPEGTKRRSRPLTLKESAISIDRGPKEVASRTVSRIKTKESILAARASTSQIPAASTSEMKEEIANSSDLSPISSLSDSGSGSGSDSSDLSDAEDSDEQPSEGTPTLQTRSRRTRPRRQRRQAVDDGDPDEYVRDRNGRFSKGKRRAFTQALDDDTEDDAEEAGDEADESDAENEDEDEEEEEEQEEEEEDDDDDDEDGEGDGSTMQVAHHLQRSSSLQGSKGGDDRLSGRRRGRVKMPRTKARGEGEPEDFIDRTFVWAKMTGYPFSPAVIVEPRLGSTEIPDEVLQAAKDPDEIHLVRFYGGQRAEWKWMSTRKLRFMFEDHELDNILVKAPGARTAHRKALIREAFKLAQAEM